MFKDTLRLPLIGWLGVVWMLSVAPAYAGPAKSGPADAAVVRLEGQIDDYTRDNFIKRFNQAKATGAKVIIVDLDTYGGLVTAGLDLSQFLKSQTDVHTIAFVGSKAISAGAMIAISCKEIVMTPSALLGDCAPIAVNERGHVETMGPAERQKAESPIITNFENSAAVNGYDPLLVKAMVVGDVVVHWVEGPDGQRKFVDENQFKALLAKSWTEVTDPDVSTPVDTDKTLLTLHGRSALKLGIASQLEPGIPALAAHRDYKILATFAPSAGDRIIEWLNNPIVRMFLIGIFVLCLYTALHAPGHGAAEAMAMLALAILVGVPLLTGYASWWEILLIIVGMGLLALEIFVIPGFGVTGILGIVMLLFGLVMTFVPKEPGSDLWPHLEGTWVALRNGLAAVIGALVASMFIAMWLRRFLPRLPYLNKLILTTVSGGGPPALPGMPVEAAPFRPAIGAMGEALSELRPGGSGRFYDAATADYQVVSVSSDVGYIAHGTRIIVHSIGDNRIVVRPAEG